MALWHSSQSISISWNTPSTLCLLTALGPREDPPPLPLLLSPPLPPKHCGFFQHLRPLQCLSLDLCGFQLREPEAFRTSLWYPSPLSHIGSVCPKCMVSAGRRRASRTWTHTTAEDDRKPGVTNSITSIWNMGGKEKNILVIANVPSYQGWVFCPTTAQIKCSIGFQKSGNAYL